MYARTITCINERDCKLENLIFSGLYCDFVFKQNEM